MDKFVDELHNNEDTDAVWRAVLLFLGLLLGLGGLGVMFWAAV